MRRLQKVLNNISIFCGKLRSRGYELFKGCVERGIWEIHKIKVGGVISQIYKGLICWIVSPEEKEF